MEETRCPAGEWQSENLTPDLTASKVCISKPLSTLPPTLEVPKYTHSPGCHKHWLTLEKLLPL